MVVVLLLSELMFVFFIAGICALGAVRAGAWVFYAAMNSSTGGGERSTGAPLLR